MSKTLRAVMIIVVPITVTVGQSRGVITRRTIWNSLAPSIRAASITSELIAFRLAEMVTRAKPTALQIPTKIKAALFVFEFTNHATGWAPTEPMIAFSVPVWTEPGGW